MAVYNIIGDRADLSEPKIYNFLAYNVGNFSNGTNTGYIGDNLEEYITEWVQFFGEYSPDVCFLTESRSYIDNANTASSNERIYSSLYKYVTNYNLDKPYGAAILTNEPQTNVIKNLFTNRVSSESKYICADVNLNGVELCIIVVHLNHTVAGHEQESVEARIAQVEEVITMAEDYENVIIGGDFNFRQITQFQQFAEAGYTLANGGIFGNFATMDNDSGYTSDGIVIKGDKIKLKDFKVFKGVTSGDHLATMTKILIG